MLVGQHKNPASVVAFTVSEGWSRDASDTVARELRRRCDIEGRELPASTADIVEWNEGTLLLDQDVNFISKPFTIEQLGAKARGVLDGPDVFGAMKNS
jgi:hypothetical protein